MLEVFGRASADEQIFNTACVCLCWAESAVHDRRHLGEVRSSIAVSLCLSLVLVDIFDELWEEKERSENEKNAFTSEKRPTELES